MAARGSAATKDAGANTTPLPDLCLPPCPAGVESAASTICVDELEPGAFFVLIDAFPVLIDAFPVLMETFPDLCVPDTPLIVVLPDLVEAFPADW